MDGGERLADAVEISNPRGWSEALALILSAICWSVFWVMQPSAPRATRIPGMPPTHRGPSSDGVSAWRMLRARSAEFVARAKAGTAEMKSSNEEENVADQRAMNDPSLRAGDIISTSRGLVFRGLEDGEQRGRDFRSATKSEIGHFASVDAEALVSGRPARFKTGFSPARITPVQGDR